MKSLSRTILAVGMFAAVSSSYAATILSQNFDTDPVNYTLPPGSDFVFQASDPARYWGPSNIGMTVNPGVTGNSTVYLAAQNMNNDGDGTLFFDQFAPAQVDFMVNVRGFSDLRLSIDLAGMPTAEPENFLRLFTDDDGDGFYETPIFNFMGGSNSPYVDATLGALSGAFATFADLPLNFPTTADQNLRVRLEMFTDTNSQNEAQGADNIVISGVPEPTTSVLVAAGMLALASHRRR